MNYRKAIVDLAFVATFFFVAATVLAQSDSGFAKANQEFAAGNFKEAIEGYEMLARSGQTSANLFYNLGNAYFRTEDFGHAILNYERALALDRNHPEANANIRIARDEARALELAPSRMDRVLQTITLQEYTIAAAVVFWIGIFELATFFLAKRRTGILAAMSILSLSIFAVLVVAIVAIEKGNKGYALAIVTGQDVEARVATADNANSVLALPAGSEIRILSKRGDWIYAALPNDLRGWIASKSAEPVRL